MNRFRYWLADLISGGDLTFRKNGWDRSAAISQERASAISELVAMNADQRAEISKLLNNITMANLDAGSGWANSERFSEALRQIAAQVKPTSNATVKRMGRIAEEALK